VVFSDRGGPESGAAAPLVKRYGGEGGLKLDAFLGVASDHLEGVLKKGTADSLAGVFGIHKQGDEHFGPDVGPAEDFTALLINKHLLLRDAMVSLGGSTFQPALNDLCGIVGRAQPPDGSRMQLVDGQCIVRGCWSDGAIHGVVSKSLQWPMVHLSE